MEKPPKNADQAYQDKVNAAKDAYKLANDRFTAESDKLEQEIQELWANRYERVHGIHEKLATAQVNDDGRSFVSFVWFFVLERCNCWGGDGGQY